ncbi:MAG: HAMP domain-containing protein [Acidobacteria bacterium]|nr:HAMP domain-containing protein [Acidobacteriota bacterium]
MRKRVLIGLGAVVLALLVVMLVWQGSFTLGDYAPVSPEQTVLFWAISTLVALLTIIVGFMLFRTGVKLYIERQSNRAGSRIRTKLISGALALSFVPVICLVLFGYGVMNRNLAKWFSRPAEGVNLELTKTGKAIRSEFETRVTAQARWLAITPQTYSAAGGGDVNIAFFSRKCDEQAIDRLWLTLQDGQRLDLCVPKPAQPERLAFTVRVPVEGVAGSVTLSVTAHMPIDLASEQAQINRYVSEYLQLGAYRNQMRNLYLLYITAIALFVLFVATWIARILADQISNPISALLRAAGEARRGNLSYRLHIRAIDELATLVRGFNEMMQALEENSKELESRRRFTEAILESIPTGVISITGDGRIVRINRALAAIFAEDRIARATYFRDLFPQEDAAELRYLMNRARRTGLAATQLELKTQGKTMNLAVTVAALDPGTAAGFVLVLEDTSELLRAQRVAAWQEVARRVAHELKNPLTPIALGAERIARQIDRGLTADSERIIRECSVTIAREVETVRTLVDEFSQFSRFPASQPVPTDLNQIVRAGLEVFSGRLEGIDVRVSLEPELPRVNVDPEHFKRIVVNLVDNAAEAMQNSMVRGLLVATRLLAPEIVELVVADTGPGVSPEVKEKLFLPYFSTKRRGTGLGLAIVARIAADNAATIRVEENKPAGTRFIIEIPALPAAPESPEITAAEARR